MQTVTRTASSAKLQTAQLLKVPLTMPPHSTLNERLNINANITVPDTTLPSLKYSAIGNGGHKVAVGPEGIPFLKPVQHLPRHTGLYNQLPFVIRTLTNDLTAEERARYRLRAVIIVGGVSYAAYYLKVLDLSTTVAEVDYYTVANNVTTATAFVPTSSDLNPIPPDLTSTGVIATSGDYIAATARVPFTMTPADIVELLNVANVLYGEPNLAMISEIALCTGVDKQVTGNFNGSTASYTEAIGVQVASYVTASYPAAFCNQGINLAFDIGSVEPMVTVNVTEV